MRSTPLRATEEPATDALKKIHAEDLQKRRATWLQRHEQDTADIMRVCLLRFNCPMRFNMTVDARRRIFKQTWCHLNGWELHERDQETATGSRLPELILERCSNGCLSSGYCLYHVTKQ